MPQQQQRRTSFTRKRAYPEISPSNNNEASDYYHNTLSASPPSNIPAMDMDALEEQVTSMFAMEEQKCPCLLCLKGTPPMLQKETVAWYLTPPLLEYYSLFIAFL